MYPFFWCLKALPREINWSCDIGAPVEGMCSGSLRSSRVDAESSLRALAMIGVVVSRTISSQSYINQVIKYSSEQNLHDVDVLMVVADVM